MSEKIKYIVVGSCPHALYLKVVVLDLIPFGFSYYLRVKLNLNLVDSIGCSYMQLKLVTLAWGLLMWRKVVPSH